MKQFFLCLFLIGNCTFANVSKGQVDTILINKIGVKIFDAFKDKSYSDYQQILMSKSDYRNVIRKTNWELFPKNKFKEGYSFLMKRAERQFALILKKGEYQNIDWANIEFEKFIFHSEETQLINQIEPEPIGFLVSGHLVFKIDDIYFTLIGIKLLKFGNTYRIFSSPEGVYPVRLEQYIATDSIDLNKNGTN